MSCFVVSAENLGKRYRLAARRHNVMLRDVLARSCTLPFRRLFARANRKPETNDTVRSPASKVQDGTPSHIWALKNVGFEIKMGEVVGIVGRNGAGKSTLLKILSRITEPTEGEVRIYGRVGSLLEVGTGFHSELTGRENIYLSGAILGMKKAEIDRKFDEIVAFAEVETFIEIPVKHYSSGMYMRLAFAVAAHLEPELLIVDEVLAVGDAAFQKKCLVKMEAVAKDGRTVLLVSHDMAMIEHFCKRVLLLDRGQLVMSGSAGKALAAYVTSFSPDAAHDLRSIRRGPNLLPIIRKLEFVDGDGRPVNAVPAGSALTVYIYYDHSEPITNPSFGITVESASGIKIFWLQTPIQNGPLPDLPSSGVVRCHIPCLSLVPGDYFISLGCGSGNMQLDLVPRVCQLQVIGTDVYGTGRLPDAENGYVLMNAKWEAEVEAR